MKKTLPRVLLAATHSGAGKTTLVCGLLQALKNRGLSPAAFKCGPDYIDPMFHSEVIGAKSGNLDLFFTPPDTVRMLLAEGAEGCDVSVLEGVMGYYDGLGGTTERASAYDLACATETPAVLIVDAKGASLSLCALLSGFLAFREDSRIAGVILNRCTQMQYQMLRPLLARECGVEVLGYLPFDARLSLQSRHLGLVTAAEISNLKEKLMLLAALLEETVDIDRLLALAQGAPPVSYAPLSLAPVTKGAPVIAVARDAAFCFYYRENLSLLERLGARLAPFSPLYGEALPEGACALYLGGGYPELYGEQLARNKAMLAAVRQAVKDGMPVFAECGGFLYLHESLIDQQGAVWPLVGALPGTCRFAGKLKRFGYVELTAQTDGLLAACGEKTRAHEFHYFESDTCGTDFTAKKPVRGTEWSCIHAGETMHAGFPHLYFYSNPSFAERFVKAAARYGAAHGKD